MIRCLTEPPYGSCAELGKSWELGSCRGVIVGMAWCPVSLERIRDLVCEAQKLVQLWNAKLFILLRIDIPSERQLFICLFWLCTVLYF